jgi:hypothetical protein
MKSNGMGLRLRPQDHQINHGSNAPDALYGSLCIEPLQVRFDVTEKRYFTHPYDWHNASTQAGHHAAQAGHHICDDVAVRSAAGGSGDCGTVGNREISVLVIAK